MNKNNKPITKKSTQKNEVFCPCGCITQLDKLKTGNPLTNKRINKKISCC